MSSLASSLEKKTKRIFWGFLSGLVPTRGSSAPSLGPSPSILVLRPDRLGDFILSVPALFALQKELGSGLKLTLVAGNRFKELAQFFRFFFPRATILVSGKFFFKGLFLWTRLWRGRYDATLDLHSYPFSTTSALTTLSSGSPHRIGFEARGEFKGISRKIFNRAVPPPRDEIHESERNFLLIRKLCPSIKKLKISSFQIPPIPAETKALVRSFYTKMGINKNSKILGIHPTLQKKDNRWSPQRYSELVQSLKGISGLKIVVVYGGGEEKDLREFLKRVGSVPNLFVVSQNDILFILEAAKRFDLFVCGDSGLTHLAGLVTKVYAVFGPTNPKRWGPMEVGNKHMIFRKKDKKCDSVKADEVAKEVQKYLTRSPFASRQRATLRGHEGS